MYHFLCASEVEINSELNLHVCCSLNEIETQVKEILLALSCEESMKEKKKKNWGWCAGCVLTRGANQVWVASRI